MILPPEAAPLLAAFAPLFTQPTFDRFATLTAAAILTPGRHTVANLVRALGRLAPGHRTTYQRVLSAARWSGVELGCAPAAFLLARLVPDGPVVLVGDDTVDGGSGSDVEDGGPGADQVEHGSDDSVEGSDSEDTTSQTTDDDSDSSNAGDGTSSAAGGTGS